MGIAYQQGKCAVMQAVMEDVHFSAGRDESFYHTFLKGKGLEIVLYHYREGVAWHCLKRWAIWALILKSW